MSCNNLLCLDQLLEPDPQDDLIVINSNGSPALIETGVATLLANVTEVTINFLTPKQSTDYVFNQLQVENLVDQNPLAIVPQVSSRTKTGFTVLLNAKPDTGNYQLRYSIAVVGT